MYWNGARPFLGIANRLKGQMSFRVFLAMAALVILLPIHAVIGVLVMNDMESRHHRIESELRTITKMAAAAVDADVGEWLSDLQTLASRVAREPTDLPLPRELLTAYLEHHLETSALAATGVDDLIVAQPGGLDTQEIAPLFWAIPDPTGTAGGRTVLSRLLISPADGTPLIGIAVTVRTGSRSIATVKALHRLDYISPILAEEDTTLGWQIAIVDQDDKVLAASDRSLVGKSFPPGLTSRSGASRVSILRARVDDVDLYLAVAAATVAQWRVVSRVPAAVLEESLRTEVFGFLVLGGLLVLPVSASVLLGRYLGRRLEALADAASAVSGEVMSRTMEPTGLREIDVVQQALRSAREAVREQTEARERLQDMKEALDRAQRMESVGQVMAAVAHDFGNLIFTISGNLELLRRSLDEQAQEQHLIEPSLRMTNEAMRLISQLSAGARQKRQHAQRVNVNAELAEISDLLRQVAGRSITVTIQPIDDLLDCRLDPTLLRSALLNLVVNARRAMPRGGEIRIATGNVLLDEQAAVAKEVAAGPYVMVSVSDSGIGIPVEVRGRIFEPFFSTRENEGGSGFGLSILFGFVKAAGGHVDFDTVVGKGTAFTLTFPAVREVKVDTDSHAIRQMH